MLSGNELLSGPRFGFLPGFTAIIHASGSPPSAVPGLQIDFGLLHPAAGEVLAETHASESVWVLLRRALMDAGFRPAGLASG